MAWRPSNNTTVQVNAPSSVAMGGESVARKSDRAPVIAKPKPHKRRIGPPLVIVPEYYRKT